MANRSAPSIGLFPGKVQLSAVDRTISQVQVNEALVGDANLLGYAFEIAYGILIQANRDLLF